MRRMIVAFMLGALIFGAPIVGAAAQVTVKNPMIGPLDGGGHNIINVVNYVTSAGAVMGGVGFTGISYVIRDSLDAPTVTVLVAAGPNDPSVSPPSGNNPPGSLYLRQSGGAGELWIKYGPNLLDWARVYP